MVKYVKTKEDFDKSLEEAGDKLVVVDFTATWCGPCQRIAPKFEAMSEDPANANVIFLKVDVDEASDIAEKNGITAMPTFMFFKNKKEIDKVTGADEKKLREKMDKHK